MTTARWARRPDPTDGIGDDGAGESTTGGAADGDPSNEGDATDGTDGSDTGGTVTGGTDTDGTVTGASTDGGSDTGTTGTTDGSTSAGTGTDGEDTGGDTGDVPGPASGDGATSFGFVQIERSASEDGDVFDADEISVSASFYRFDMSLPIDGATSRFLPRLDTCTVSRSDDGLVDGEGDLGEGLPGFDLTSLSAGQTITFTSPVGTWLTLPRTELENFVTYQSEDALSPPVPGDLVLDIPGDRFPAFSAISVPDVTPLEGLVPSPGTIVTVGPDTVFRWNGGDDPDVHVGIELYALEGEGAFAAVDCLARDDGEFALPATTRAELGDGFSGRLGVSRAGVRAAIEGDALLLVTSSISAD